MDFGTVEGFSSEMREAVLIIIPEYNLRTATRSERIITWNSQAEEQKWIGLFCAHLPSSFSHLISLSQRPSTEAWKRSRRVSILSILYLDEIFNVTCLNLVYFASLTIKSVATVEYTGENFGPGPVQNSTWWDLGGEPGEAEFILYSRSSKPSWTSVRERLLFGFIRYGIKYSISQKAFDQMTYLTLRGANTCFKLCSKVKCISGLQRLVSEKVEILVRMFVSLPSALACKIYE